MMPAGAMKVRRTFGTKLDDPTLMSMFKPVATFGSGTASLLPVPR